ncbi:helix-turn-helix transcriptional regulator [Nocardia sp. NPDC046763]|uniref:helix-turn-helix domain-containing protein n=1 Tax=Nocardia sp. NPDC046763 TaxID=3155256 RepID=UPI0033C75930
MDPNDLVLAEVVKDAINAAGITQKEVWKHVGIAETTWERRIAGAKSFTMSELFRISEMVGVPSSELVAKVEGSIKAQVVS